MHLLVEGVGEQTREVDIMKISYLRTNINESAFEDTCRKIGLCLSQIVHDRNLAGASF
jgi:hypothetical protein